MSTFLFGNLYDYAVKLNIVFRCPNGFSDVATRYSGGALQIPLDVSEEPFGEVCDSYTAVQTFCKFEKGIESLQKPMLVTCKSSNAVYCR